MFHFHPVSVELNTVEEFDAKNLGLKYIDLNFMFLFSSGQNSQSVAITTILGCLYASFSQNVIPMTDFKLLSTVS